MDGGLHPPKTKSKGFGAAIVDVIFALVVMFTLGVAMIVLFDNRVRDDMARAYVRHFHPASEEACPRGFGKPFWFTCAAEVRRVKGSSAL